MHSFTVYEEYYDLITLLDEEEQKEFLLALFRYMFEDKEPTLNDKQMKIFKNLKRPLDKSKIKSKATSKRNQNEIKTKTHQDVNVNVNVYVNKLIEYIESNLGITINGFNFEKIEKLFDDYDLEILKYAIDVTVANNKKTLNYFLAIVRNWKQAGYKTLDEIKSQTKKKPIPEWLNKEIVNEDIDPNEDTFNEFLEDFRNEKK